MLSYFCSMIEQTACKDKRNAAQMFLDEWSTMGRKRPTLRTLLELLMRAELFRAADYIACDILKRTLYINYILYFFFFFIWLRIKKNFALNYRRKTEKAGLRSGSSC